MADAFLYREIVGDEERIEYCCICGHQSTKTYKKRESLYSEVKDNRYSCPHCGTYCQQFNDYSYSTRSGEYDFFPTEIIRKEETEIEFVVTPITIEFDRFHGFGKVFTMNRHPVRHINIKLVPQPEITLKLDGAQVKPTKTNIKKVLAHVPVSIYKDTIWGILATRMGTNAASTPAIYLHENPWMEKIYTTGGKELHFYSVLENNPEQRRLLQTDKKKPHQILGLNKPLYERYIRHCATLSSCGLKYKDLMKLVERYGCEKTTTIIELTLELTRVRRSNPISWVKLILDNRLNFDHKAMFDYLTNSIWTYQGIADPNEGAQLLYDYINICLQMGVPYELHPRSLKLVHDIAVKNHEIILKEEERKAFTSAVNKKEYQELAWEPENEKYIVMAPKQADDLVYEGSALSHCVGSYVSNVSYDDVKILFMRSKDAPKDPCVTLDVRNGKIIQAAGFGNRSLYADEYEFVQKWAKAKKLDSTLVYRR